MGVPAKRFVGRNVGRGLFVPRFVARNMASGSNSWLEGGRKDNRTLNRGGGQNRGTKEDSWTNSWHEGGFEGRDRNSRDEVRIRGTRYEFVGRGTNSWDEVRIRGTRYEFVGRNEDGRPH